MTLSKLILRRLTKNSNFQIPLTDREIADAVEDVESFKNKISRLAPSDHKRLVSLVDDIINNNQMAEINDFKACCKELELTEYRIDQLGYGFQKFSRQ